eukprot:gene12501-14674_t
MNENNIELIKCKTLEDIKKISSKVHLYSENGEVIYADPPTKSTKDDNMGTNYIYRFSAIGPLDQGLTVQTITIKNADNEVTSKSFNYFCSMPATEQPLQYISQSFDGLQTITLTFSGQPLTPHSISGGSQAFNLCYGISQPTQVNLINPNSCIMTAKLSLSLVSTCDYTVPYTLSIVNAYSGANIAFTIIPPLNATTPKTTIIHSITTSLPNGTQYLAPQFYLAWTYLDIETPNTIISVANPTGQYRILGTPQRSIYLQSTTVQQVPSTAFSIKSVSQNIVATNLFKTLLTSAPTNNVQFGQLDISFSDSEFTGFASIDMSNLVPDDQQYLPFFMPTRLVAISYGISGVTGYPLTYGIANGTMQSYNFHFPMVFSNYRNPPASVATLIYSDVAGAVSSFQITKPATFPTTDTAVPWVSSVSYFPIDTYHIIMRVTAGDLLSGISRIIFRSQTFTEADLVSGTIFDGIYECLLELVPNNPTSNTLQVIDLATNVYSINTGNFFIHSLTIFPHLTYEMNWAVENFAEIYFTRNDIDTTGLMVESSLVFKIGPSARTDFKPRMRFNIMSAGANQAFDFAGAWNPSLNAFQVNFTLPPNMMEGNVPYSILTFPPISDDTLATKHPNARLRVTSQYGDNAPPMVSNVVAFPSTRLVQTAGVDSIGWTITIEDKPNGFSSGMINVTSNFDPIPYQFKLSAANRISGDIYTGTYRLTVPLNPLNCRNQTFIISSITLSDIAHNFAVSTANTGGIFGSFDKINFSPFQSQMSIRVDTECSDRVDTTPPIILADSLPGIIDVGNSPGRASFSFIINDPESGIAVRNPPNLYLESVGCEILTYSPSSNYNGTLSYNVIVPFGYGASGHKIIASLYGATNNHLSISGLPLIASMVRLFSKTPTLLSYSPISVHGGQMTIYGRFFTTSSLGITGVYKILTESFAMPIPTFFLGTMIVFNMPPISDNYIITMSVSGVDTNKLFIIPYPDPEVVPTDPPLKCPGIPPCSNNGECLTTGCRCIDSWSGPDCSLRIIIVNTTIGDESPIISIVSLQEITSDNVVVEEFVFTSWTVTKLSDASTGGRTKYLYSSPINSTRTTVVNVTIEVFDVADNITFAEHVVLDPDFSYLVGNGGDDSANEICSSGSLSKKLTPGMIAGIVVGSVIFGWKFNQPIAPGVLPEGLTSLTFGHDFNQAIAPGVLPAALTSLTFGDDFDQAIAPGVLPSGLTSLIFGFLFNKQIKSGVLPDGLTSLTFGYLFNKPIAPGILPHGLTSLTFGECFDRPIKSGVLPNGLTSLSFGHHFVQPIAPGVLPHGLTSLIFGERFNQPIKSGVLPDGLINLTFGDGFNQAIAHGVLPHGLTSLTFGDKFNRPIKSGVLPDGLTSLTFGECFFRLIEPGVLPNGLASLTFGDDFPQPIAPGVLPDGLSSLTFGEWINDPIAPGVLPDGLSSLTFGFSFNQPIVPGVLPDGLISLTFGYSFNQPIEPGVLPNGLTSLTFGSCFNQPIVPRVLPDGLTSLAFGVTLECMQISNDQLLICCREAIRKISIISLPKLVEESEQ